MPYIKQVDREGFEPALEALCEIVRNRLTFGNVPPIAMFNYIAFKLLRLLPESYTNMSAGMAGFNDAVEEYRRRFMNPLEDLRREENGDV